MMMQKYRIIRFKPALTQLVIEGKKDMTRRLTTDRQFEVGEILAVSEAYGFIYRGLEGDIQKAYMERLKVELDIDDPTRHPGWENKLYVRPELMQRFIRITEKREELLQDISDEDIMREGIFHGDYSCRDLVTGEEGDYTWLDIKRKRLPNGKYHVFFKYYVNSNARDAFVDMFNHVVGKKIWEKNPPVYVYAFKQMDMKSMELSRMLL